MLKSLAEGGRPFALDVELRFEGASIDSRSIRPGELFVALPGGRTDGHRFVSEALGRGAAAALVRRDYLPDAPGLERHLVRVEDPLTALQALAAARRSRFRGAVVGVTGSSGKTTTREMIAVVLEGRYRVHRTEGNRNNQIGVPLTLLGLSESHTAAVVEMGMNAPGEIAFLSRMVRPGVGVITNVGAAHLEGLGGVKEVLRAKLEMTEALEGPLVIPADDESLAEAAAARGARVFRVGFENGADLRAAELRSDAEGSRFRVEDTEFRLSVPGRFLVRNALAAVAVGRILGVPLPDAARRLAAFSGVEGRFRVRRLGDLLLIDDSYNANPLSLEAALFELSVMEGRRVAVLGEMFELGARAEEFHRKAGRWARRYGVDLLVGVGPLMRHAVASYGPGGTFFEGAAEAAAEIGSIVRAGDRILVKGSRAARMERIVEAIENAL